MGFPPRFTNLTRFVFNPMAPIAITIRNLLSRFRYEKTVKAVDNTTPVQKPVSRVVAMEARIKYKINMGKMFLIDIAVA